MVSTTFRRTIVLGSLGILIAGLAVVLAGQAGRGGVAMPAVDSDDIGGVVTGARGPEAGVWVIAETRNLPTRMMKIVVTDDQGRFVVPDLPTAEYDVWVRGYGLNDSAKVKASPGKTLNLTAVAAPNASADGSGTAGVTSAQLRPNRRSSICPAAGSAAFRS